MRVSVPAVALTSAAMVAFAANSLLCRFALRDAGIDPYGFTAVRLASGAAMLWVLMRLRRASGVPADAASGAPADAASGAPADAASGAPADAASGAPADAASGVSPGAATESGSWPGGFWLFAYALGFSYAYLELDAGTGALLLFGVVQATMILAGIAAGERPGLRETTGLLLAAGGVVYLVLPTVSTPALLPALSMATAGLAWGLYSLRGRGVTDPGRATCGNFLRTLPMVLVMLLVAALSRAELRLTGTGLLLATASGALASGLGYVLWYAALAHLDATRAAIVQLTAPVLAAIGGAVLLAETLSLRLGIATVLVLGGVALATTARRT